MNQFQEEIRDWNQWHSFSCSVPVFAFLIEKILKKENLSQGEIVSFPPATNAVFRVEIYVPKVIASGVIEDKYRFFYMITEYIQAETFREAVNHMTVREKREIVSQLREITDRWNVPCEPFNSVDVILERKSVFTVI